MRESVVSSMLCNVGIVQMRIAEDLSVVCRFVVHCLFWFARRSFCVFSCRCHTDRVVWRVGGDVSPVGAPLGDVDVEFYVARR